MFASKHTKSISFPEGVVTIRKLAYGDLDDAQDARQRKAAQSARDMGPEMVKAFRDGGEKPAATPVQLTPEQDLAAQKKARYDSYERSIVLVRGVASLPDTAAENTAKAVRELDEPTADQLHREILDYSLPPLEEGEAKAQAKND
jgi:hypothetical protein